MATDDHDSRRAKPSYGLTELSRLGNGDGGIVDRVEADLRVRQHLAVLGILPGAAVRVLQAARRARGGVVISCGDTRLALGPREAARVLMARVGGPRRA